MFLDLLKQELGEDKPAGDQTRFDCPFCGENKKRFYVHNTKGLWICFRCSDTGNPVSFTMNYFSIGFPEATDILASFDYNVEEMRDNSSFRQYDSSLTEEEQLLLFISREGAPIEVEEEVKIPTCPPLPTQSKPLISNFDNQEAFPFLTYLHGRGVTYGQIKQHNIHYTTYGEITLIDGRQLGLRNHLVLPTHNQFNQLVFWNTRSIEPDGFIKSFNAPSKEEEYSKHNSVFNLNNAQRTSKIVIQEGVFDALTVGDSGVATFGKKVTRAQIALIATAAKENNIPIYIFLDGDAKNEMVRTAKDLREAEQGLTIYYVVNTTDADANDLGREACHQLIDNALLADAQGELQLDLLFTL